MLVIYIFFFKKRFHLVIRVSERMSMNGGEGEEQREGERQAPH